MRKIVLILPYWGRFPDYFQYFLESVRRNPDIDLLLYTDDIADHVLPGNVFLKPCSFAEFKAKIQKAFDFTLNHLQTPYNLCDFKPAYGYALREDLAAYDFWGHCDCDLIFGNIREFVTDELLDRYDRILSRGHLTIYRNNEETNRAFMNICTEEKNYRKVYQSSSNIIWSYDEWPGMSMFWKNARQDRMFDGIVFDDVWFARKHFVSYQKRDADKRGGKANFIYVYKNGRLFRYGVKNGRMISEPTCYAHFQKRHLDIMTSGRNYNEYMIVPNKILDYEELDCGKITHYGRRRLLYADYLKLRWRNLVRKIGGCRKR